MNPNILSIILIICIILIFIFFGNENDRTDVIENADYYNQMDNRKLESLDSSIIIENVQKVTSFYNSILNSEKKVYSQNGEDGVLERLIEIIQINKVNGYYVEFGTQNGRECNTRYLREKFNWTGLLMDGRNENLMINLHKEVILFSNILQLFDKYNVRKEIDILSEDTDYNDYYIVQEILKEYRPKILVHEINQQPPEMCVTVPKDDRLIFWDGSNFHGGSVCAFWCLAKENDYTMVYCDKRGVNCFWLRNDLVERHLGLKHDFVKLILTPKLLYKKPNFVFKSTDRKWAEVSC